jgi:hypothetical protein
MTRNLSCQEQNHTTAQASPVSYVGFVRQYNCLVFGLLIMAVISNVKSNMEQSSEDENTYNFFMNEK